MQTGWICHSEPAEGEESAFPSGRENVPGDLYVRRKADPSAGAQDDKSLVILIAKWIALAKQLITQLYRAFFSTKIISCAVLSSGVLANEPYSSTTSSPVSKKSARRCGYV